MESKNKGNLLELLDLVSEHDPGYKTAPEMLHTHHMGGQNRQNYMPILRGCTHFDGVVFINKGVVNRPHFEGWGGGGGIYL